MSYKSQYSLGPPSLQPRRWLWPVERAQDQLQAPVIRLSSTAAPGRSRDPLSWDSPPVAWGLGPGAPGWLHGNQEDTQQGICSEGQRAQSGAVDSHWPFSEAAFWAESGGQSSAGIPS